KSVWAKTRDLAAAACIPNTDEGIDPTQALRRDVASRRCHKKVLERAPTRFHTECFTMVKARQSFEVWHRCGTETAQAGLQSDLTNHNATVFPGDCQLALFARQVGRDDGAITCDVGEGTRVEVRLAAVLYLEAHFRD